MSAQYKKKVCVVTCYRDPDYVRARVLRGAVKLAGAEVVTVKNSKKGIMRYPEVLYKLLKVRFIEHPDLYIVTFRGYEIFPFVRLLTVGKPLWYDEFINPIEWVVFEHKKLPDWKLWRWLYKSLLWPVQLILTDTESHAELSAKLTGVRRDKIASLPVSTDEATFSFEAAKKRSSHKRNKFSVFYYGNMLPLHGLDTVISAAKGLKDSPLIEFIIIGGNDKTVQKISEAQQQGAQIDYKRWVDFDLLPDYMANADLCLAGPFGGTLQAQYVITGKAYQYLNMGRPIVVGRNYESEVFTDKKNALLVEQNNPDALADTIKWAHGHQDKLSSIGVAGKKLYDEKFSNRAVAEKLKKLF